MRNRGYAPLAATLIALLAGRGPVAAQTQPAIGVGANVQVSAARDTLLHDEVVLAAHPTDPDRLIACSIAAPPGDFALRTIAYTSSDGGSTWTPTVTDLGPYSGDPVCLFGPDHTAWFLAIAYRARPPVLRVYRSDDDGLSWSDSTEISRVPDRPWLAVDRTDGPYHGRLYLPFNALGALGGTGPGEQRNALGLLTSSDGGATFGNPVFRGLLTDTASLGYPGGAVVLSDGTLVVLLHRMHTPRPDPPGRGRSVLMVHTSTDGGRTLSEGIKVSDVVGLPAPEQGQERRPSVDGLPVIAVDASDGPFRDRIYVAWYDARSGRSRIYLSYSADQGRTWSEPRAVSDAREWPPNTGRWPGPNAMMPSLAVNRDGIVGVSWYDRRHADDDLGWHVRFRASLDGGDTWLPSVQVSSAPERAGAAEEWTFEPMSRPLASDGGSLVSVRLAEWPTGGHTAGLAARADGVFFPLWIDGRTGRHQVWTAPVTVHGTVRAHGAAELASLDDVSSKVALDLAYVWVDSARTRLEARARLRNVSSDTVKGPLKARVLALSSPFAEVAVADADNGITGEGAVWAFPDPGEGGLAPDEEIERRVTFRLRDVRSNDPRGVFLGFLLSMRARVFGVLPPSDGPM